MQRRPRLTKPPRWFTCVHPSDLPLARLSRMARVGLGHFPLLCSGSLPTTPIGAGTVVDTQLGRNHLLYHSSVRPRVARAGPFSAFPQQSFALRSPQEAAPVLSGAENDHDLPESRR